MTLRIAGIDVAEAVSRGAGPHLPVLDLRIGGAPVKARGVLTVSADGTATATLIHGTEQLVGSVTPQEGDHIYWLEKRYRISAVGGVPQVAWEIIGSEAEIEERDDVADMSISSSGRAIMVSWRGATRGDLRWRYRALPDGGWSSTTTAAGRSASKAVAPGAYMVEAWVVAENGKRTQPASAEVSVL